MKTLTIGTALLGALLITTACANDGDRKGPPPSFSDIDSNSDGYITTDEAKGPLARDFSSIDADGDGKVTEAELSKFMSKHRPPARD